MHGAAFRDLRQAFSLRIIESPVDRYLALHPFDPAVLPRVAIRAVVGVNPIVLELNVDRGEVDSLVVRV